MTRDELTSRTGTHQRYITEWLERQVTTGILEVDDPAAGHDARVYSLSAAHREVLCDRDSLSYLTPFARLMTAGGLQLTALLDAYRDGGGVPWERYGPDMRTGQADMNRPWFINALGSEWFPAVPELDQRLHQDGARVADIGCGEGWSSIAIAQAYPGVTVDGFDIDEASIVAARDHARNAGVSARVHFHLVDGSGASGEDSYDVVTLFECVHDMAHPIEVLKAARSLAKPDGHVIVMDEAVADSFGDSTDEVERLMYGFSLFVCLPDGLSHEGASEPERSCDLHNSRSTPRGLVSAESRSSPSKTTCGAFTHSQCELVKRVPRVPDTAHRSLAPAVLGGTRSLRSDRFPAIA